MPNRVQGAKGLKNMFTWLMEMVKMWLSEVFWYFKHKKAIKEEINSEFENLAWLTLYKKAFLQW